MGAPKRGVEEFRGMLAGLLGGADRWDVDVVDWPGREGAKVGLRILSDFQVAEADARARAWAKAHDMIVGQDRSDVEFNYQRLAEWLSVALVTDRPNPQTGAHEPLVGSAEELRKLATREELDVLGAAFMDHQERCAPLPSQLKSDDEFKALFEALKKTRSKTVLARCAPSTLRDFALYMVERHEKSGGSPSSTTRPDGGSAPAS